MFEPTLAAARAALAAVNPAQYARTRNALGGAVTRLSPYITHSLLSIPDCLQTLSTKHTLSFDDKLVFEFAWREFFHHVWGHLGDKILQDIRPPVWPGTYADTLPTDIKQGATGVPVIDQTVRDLYATGYLHNHARMWLASYVVHLRKVHWRAGADWLYGHLLDGDLASNHLSWQWVAGTFSNKPYLFNAENVAKYAPAAYHSPGTVIDTDYETLDDIARRGGNVGREQGQHLSADAPELVASYPNNLWAGGRFDLKTLESIAAQATGRPIRLVHPWMLGEPPPGNALNIGLIHLPFHAHFPWSAARWAWVLARMQALCPVVFVGDGDDLVPILATASAVNSTATLNGHYSPLLKKLSTQLAPSPRLLPDQPRPCNSFSKFYDVARRSATSLDHLLADGSANAVPRRWHQSGLPGMDSPAI